MSKPVGRKPVLAARIIRFMDRNNARMAPEIVTTRTLCKAFPDASRIVILRCLQTLAETTGLRHRLIHGTNVREYQQGSQALARWGYGSKDAQRECREAEMRIKLRCPEAV